MGSITTRTYDEGADAVMGDELDAVSDALDSGCELVWIDFDHPSADDMTKLAGELGLHHLSVEDALDPHQRDKYVHFEHHVFLVCHAIELDLAAAGLDVAEIDLFIGDHWVVTVHRGQADLMDRLAARSERTRQLGLRGAVFVMYGLLDIVVDDYFAAIDEFERYYDEAADQVFGERPIEPGLHRQWFETRRALNQFDRMVGPLAEALHTMVDQDLDRFPPSAAPYLRDVAAEAARASTEVDALRELVNHIVDANLVLRDYHQNVVMKKVTSWAAIIAAPTLVTGYYGMNVPFAGSGETWGVVASTAIALGSSVVLYKLFRRRSWL